jgi:hypothetical protein
LVNDQGFDAGSTQNPRAITQEDAGVFVKQLDRVSQRRTPLKLAEILQRIRHAPNRKLGFSDRDVPKASVRDGLLGVQLSKQRDLVTAISEFFSERKDRIEMARGRRANQSEMFHQQSSPLTLRLSIARMQFTPNQ